MGTWTPLSIQMQAGMPLRYKFYADAIKRSLLSQQIERPSLSRLSIAKFARARIANALNR